MNNVQKNVSIDNLLIVFNVHEEAQIILFVTNVILYYLKGRQNINSVRIYIHALQYGFLSGIPIGEIHVLLGSPSRNKKVW